MTMNIKNPEAHRLAKELASLTGESMTQAVTTALRERLDRVKAEQGADLVERLTQIARDAAPHFRKGFSSLDHADLLYDERGLPR